MPEAGDDGELGDELAPTLVRLRRPLHGVGGCCARHGRLVHRAERASADDSARVESSGRHAQLLVAELPWPLEQPRQEDGVLPRGELCQLLHGHTGEEHERDSERDGAEDGDGAPKPFLAGGAAASGHAGYRRLRDIACCVGKGGGVGRWRQSEGLKGPFLDGVLLGAPLRGGREADVHGLLEVRREVDGHAEYGPLRLDTGVAQRHLEEVLGPAVVDPRGGEVAALEDDPGVSEVDGADGGRGAEVQPDVVVAGVAELDVDHGVEFHGDDGGADGVGVVVTRNGGGRDGGVEEAEVAAGGAERGAVGGDEEGDAVAAGGAGVLVGDDEGEPGGEGGGGVGAAPERDGAAAEHGAGAGGGHARVARQPHGAVPQEGVPQQREVGEGQRGRVDADAAVVLPRRR
uniref:Uncharacterized protein n=1 Tax=Triticum urartu TaxID=4572 RepID=A0A8R7V160_TRIUA